MAPLPYDLQSPFELLNLHSSDTPSHNLIFDTTIIAAAVTFFTIITGLAAITAIMAYRFRGSYSNPIDVVNISSDEESESEPECKLRKKKTTSKPRQQPELIDLVEDLEAIDLTGDDDEDFIRELTPGELKNLQSRSKSTTSAADVLPGYTLVKRAKTPSGITIFPSTEEEPLDVELDDGNFMRVTHLYKHAITPDVIIKGIYIQRTRRVHGYFKKNRNEVCVVLQAVGEISNPALDSSLISRPLAAVVQVRKIIFTNKNFPALSFRLSGNYYGSNEMVEETAELVCRSKYIELCNPANGKVMAGAVMSLDENEADHGCGMSDVAKKNVWLEKPSIVQEKSAHVKKEREPSCSPVFKQETPGPFIDLTGDEPQVKTGGKTGGKRRHEAIDLTSDDEPEGITKEFRKTSITEIFKRKKNGDTFTRRKESISSSFKVSKSRSPSTSSTRNFGRNSPIEEIIIYTYGDICAGAGGMTRGATSAGFQPVFLLDHWRQACETLHKNWPQAKVLVEDIFTFCTKNKDRSYVRIDVLHISFPCQTYSLAHTQPGRNDDDNEAAGYSVLPLLKLCRPRVVTFEQTWTLLTVHTYAFAALIHQLTSLNYNVRWKIFKCDEYGNVQPRKRLIVIASCPGEPLPPFPKPTHGTTFGLKRPVTIKDRLALVPRNLSPHMSQHTEKEGDPYSPDRILRQAITTSGGEGDLHPDGDRSFNLAELASLGGFPAEHKFVGTKTDVRKQIGNAVPSMVGKAIYEEIKRSMRAADRVAGRYRVETVEID